MNDLLARLTANKFTAAFAGTVIAGGLQSSSVTTVLVVRFISAGLLNLSQSMENLSTGNAFDDCESRDGK